jgi:hypothetical protein
MILSDKLFKGAKVSDADLTMYKKILRGNTEGKEEKVIEHFMTTYITPLNGKFQKAISSVLLDSLTGELTSMQASKNIIGFQATSKAYVKAITNNYNEVAEMVFGSFMDRYDIKSKDLVKALRSEVFQQFSELTQSTMKMTEETVLKYVRTLQREMIQRNLHVDRLKKMDVLDSVIADEKKLFKQNMLKKYPDLEKALESGRVLKSKGWTDKQGDLKFRAYTLDDYTDFSVRRTLLNLDTTAAQIDATQSGERVVEFYLRDNRKLKTVPNPVCQEILSKRIKGRAILALDEEAASILGIWTVEQAKENGSMQLSRHCRHSVRRIDNVEYLRMIDKILYVGSISFKAD